MTEPKAKPAPKAKAAAKPAAKPATEDAADAVAAQAQSVAGPSHYRIRSITPRGFCRAGRRWSAAGDIVAREDFTDEQWLALEAEPMLSVTPARLPGTEGQE